jgi:hypothetical protein
MRANHAGVGTRAQDSRSEVGTPANSHRHQGQKLRRGTPTSQSPEFKEQDIQSTLTRGRHARQDPLTGCRGRVGILALNNRVVIFGKIGKQERCGRKPPRIEFQGPAWPGCLTFRVDLPIMLDGKIEVLAGDREARGPASKPHAGRPHLVPFGPCPKSLQALVTGACPVQFRQATARGRVLVPCRGVNGCPMRSPFRKGLVHLHSSYLMAISPKANDAELTGRHCRDPEPSQTQDCRR